MSWEPTDEIAFCPACGAKGSIDVEPSRDDYYLGPIFRCRECREGFYHSPADLSPVRVLGNGLSYERASMSLRMLREVSKDLLNGPSILLSELEREQKPSGGKIRVPISRSPVDEPPADL